MTQQTASVTVGGTPENPVFNFILPTGAKGEAGGWNYGVLLQATTDLNTVNTPGLYQQTSIISTSERERLNYPPTMNDFNGSMRGGLRVYPWGGSPSAIIQEYVNIGVRAANAPVPITTWRRHNYPAAEGTQWSAWSVVRPMQTVTDPHGLKSMQVWDESTNTWTPLAGPGGLTAPAKINHTTDLNALFTPGIYAVTSSAGPNLPMAASGTLTINARYLQGETYGPSITQHYVPFFGVPSREGQVEYRRTFTGDAWQPWRSYVAQRVDNTAGRTIYTWDDTTNREQMIYGDTGWRTVSASTAQQPIWSTTTLRLRRVGNLVDFVFLGTGPIDPAVLGLDIQGFRAIHADDIPSAFRPSANAYNMGFGRFTQASGSATPRQYVMCVMNASGGMHFEKDETAPNGVLLSASSSIYVSGCYTTNSAWPTILPGTASA